MNKKLCPFCGEPATRYGSRNVTVYRCGTSGPHISEDGEEEYETGRVCDMMMYHRLLKKKDEEIKKLLSECSRLRIKCGPEEMIESDYMEIE